MSDEQTFEWDNVPSDGTETAVVATDGPVNESAPEEAKAETPKEPEKRWDQEFPLNSTVRLTATDVKGNYGVVLGHPDKANVTYVKVRLTHYKSGAPRPADKQTEMDVRTSSVEKAETPKAPEPKPAAEAATAG